LVQQQMGMQDRQRKRKALRATGPRWGQQQGYGQGYMAPRRQVGGQHTPAQERIGQGRGYNARTAGGMYGGRPSGTGAAATNARGVPAGYRGMGGGYGGIGPQNITSNAQRLAGQNKYRGVGQPQQAQGQPQWQGDDPRRYNPVTPTHPGYAPQQQEISSGQMGPGQQNQQQPQHAMGYNPMTPGTFTYPHQGQQGAGTYGMNQGNPYQQNQAQAMTRQANTATAQITRPYGGTNAVQRGRYQATRRRW